jgi:hypothetical protein
MIMYKLCNGTNPNGDIELKAIKRLSDNAFIPINSDNSDYQAYLAWVAQGNTPLPADS